MKRSLLLALLLTALSTPAYAQCIQAREVGRVPVKGTIGYTAAFGAFERVAQAYGAASLLERRVLPLLRDDATEFAFTLDTTSILSAMQLPVCGDTPNDPLGMGAMDLGTGGFGIGTKFGPLAVFYASNATYRGFRPDNGYNRWGLAFGLPIMGSIVSPVAPFYQRYEGDALTLSLDFIAGFEIGNSFISGSAGYVASQGLYANLTSPLFGIFGSAVLGTSFNSAPVATIGVTDLDWLVGDLRPYIGTTSFYLRRLEYNAAPSGAIPKRELGDAKTGGFQFTTVHVEQYAIAGVLDVMGSVTLAPTKAFYDATVGYHSKGLVPEAQALARGSSEQQMDCPLFAYRASAGAVQLPVLYSHGSKGGIVPRAGFELGLYQGCGVSIFSAGVALNAADIVSVFPYARNAVSFTFKVGTIPGQKGE